MDPISSLGKRTIAALDHFGDFCRFSGHSFAWLARGARRYRNVRLLWPQLYEVGTRSVPVVMITGAFVGAVLAVQTVNQFASMGMADRMGTVVNMSVLRELGPVLAGVMLAGRVGGAFTAELGTMRVTEQIDALRAMGADPLRVLVAPRLLACVLLIPMLVIYASFMGMLGGFIVSVYIYGVNGAAFWRYAGESIGYFDIFYGPIKSLFFGVAISLICCFKGFRTAPGAAGVGQACTESFVASTMAILALDFFLGMLLNTIHESIYGVQAVF
jgi:phospholipid/cholesterol/gamma-HCH transport system permease protein